MCVTKLGGHKQLYLSGRGKLIQLERAATEKRRLPSQVQFCVSECAAISPKAGVDLGGRRIIKKKNKKTVAPNRV